MSDTPKKEQLTVDLSIAEQFQSHCANFQAAWQEALKGGPRPSMENFLSMVSEASRLGLRQQLEPIDQKYQRQLAQPEGTEELAAVKSEASAAQAGPTPTQVGVMPNQPSEHWPVPLQGAGAKSAAGPALTVVSNDKAPGAGEAVRTFTGARPERVPRDQSAAPTGYDILEVLGRGGMGVVYKARQRSLNRMVALKMVLAGAFAGPHQLARFATEGQAVARLQHPNIVQIYEVGEQDELPFFSLEYVDGGSLEKKLGGKPLPAQEAAPIMEVLARAVHYAHQNGIVHRDLKPANVLLTKAGVAKITDFGLAKVLDSDSKLTQTGVIAGTPGYMAPEQASGFVKQIGPAADIFALGAILYEMLTGRPPFTGSSPMNIVVRTMHDDPVAPRMLDPQVPRDLETICLKCLQKETEKRYASAEALAEDLRRFQAHEPIQARPVKTPERMWRWCRRNPRTAGLSAAVCVLAVILGIVITAWAARVNRERKAADDRAIQAQTAIDAASKLAQFRLREAQQAIGKGDHRRAQDLLSVKDPLVEEAPTLADMRSERDLLQQQVALYVEFIKRVDNARYRLRASRDSTTEGRLQTLQEARKQCQQAYLLHVDIKQRTGQGSCGLPPLNKDQMRLYQEDTIDVFLIGALVEGNVRLTTTELSTQQEATRQAIEWLNRAEETFPSRWIIHVTRSKYWKELGNDEAAQVDDARAADIKLRTVTDYFWDGVNETQNGEKATLENNTKQAQQHYRKAATEFAAFLQSHPGHFWGYFEWAFCQVRLGNRHDALVGFTACTHLNPDSPWPFFNRGTINLQLKQFDLANKDFDQAVERKTDFAEAYFNRGRCHAFQGKYDQALDDYSRAIQDKPGYGSAYYNRALTYNLLGRYREARDDFSAALEVWPDRADLYLQRGAASLRAKDLDAAMTDLQQATRLPPPNALSHYLIGVIHLGRRQYDPALAALEKAITLQLNFDRPRLARAQIYLRQGKHAEAIAEVDFVLNKLKPMKQTSALFDRADVYQALGRLDDAVTDYEQIIELDPKSVLAYVGLAFVLEKQGKPDQARDCYQRLVKANPASAPAYLRRAEFYRNHKQFAEALADCDSAAKHDQGSVLPALVRASIEAARGNHGLAAVETERLLQQGPAGDGHMLYAAACVLSLASQAAAAEPGGADLAKQYTERAVALLTETLDKGFHDLLYEEHNRMGSDPALAAIRQHPRVQELLKGLP